jgi:hypothetical protein
VGWAAVLLAAAWTAAGAAAPSAPAPPAPAEEAGLTFFGWSDQHIQTDGKADHLVPAIDAMNAMAMAGTAYPERIGGKVAAPAFVLGCGDITEWPTHAALDAYEQAVTKRLKIPAYDLVGNHDEGGKSPSDTVKNWIVARHGALSYAFERGGVHFAAVFAPYDDALNNPAQPIAKAALDFIRKDLARVPKGRPVVVALHLCLDAITNRDEVVEAFGDANVILVLGGHYHKVAVGEHKGFHFVQLPSPLTTTEFTVIRITPSRLVAVPYDYKAKKWVEDPNLVLDVPIKGPAPAAAPRGAPKAAGR